MRRKIILNVLGILLLASLVDGTLLTLTEAESKAASTSYEMRAKHFEEQGKEWEKRNAVAGYMPSIDYNLNYTQMDKEMVDNSNKMFEGFEGMSDLFTGMGIPAEDIDYESSKMHTTTLSYEFAINQPITNGGVEIIAIKIAKHTKNGIELQQEALRQDVIYTTRKAYFDALTAQELAIVAQQDLSWASQNLSKAKTRHEGGAIPKTDLLQWEAEVAQKESALLQAQATHQLAILSLHTFMGVPTKKVDQKTTLQPLKVFEQWYQKGQTNISGSIENNPQLKSLKSFTLAAKGYKKVSATQFFPKVNAFYSYTIPYYYSDDNKFETQDERKGWTAGVTLSIPLFSGLRNSTNYKKSNYEYMKAVVEQEQVTNQFEMNLKRIVLFYQASFESVKAAKKQQELMEKNLEIMQKRYDGGLVNQSQLLEVSLGSRMARIGYIQKLFECLLLETEYLKTTGTLEVYQ